MRKSMVLMTQQEGEWQQLLRLLPEVELHRARNPSELVACMDETAADAVLISSENQTAAADLSVLKAIVQLYPNARRILLCDAPTTALFELSKFGLVDFLFCRQMLNSSSLQRVDLSSILLPKNASTPLGYRRMH